MLRRTLAVVAVLAGLSAGVAGAGAPDPGPRIVALVPNPDPPDDRGESVTIEVPPGTSLGGLELADGETTVRLPDRTAGGRVVVSTDPAPVRNRTDRPVLELSGRLALANAGETLELRRGGRVLDAVSYVSAPEGEVYRRTDRGWEWIPIGATARSVHVAGRTDAEFFVLPDAPGRPVAAVRTARERVLLAGYTFASERISRALCAAHARGVTVRVLVEAGPVGGLSNRSASALDSLAACGIEVRAAGATDARYAYHHAKYAVIDDSAMVLTENWKPSGTGGRANRGWGVLLESPTVAADLARTFRADAAWRGSRPWRSVRADRDVVGVTAPEVRYPTRFRPERGAVDRVEVLTAPDNAEPAIVDRLDAAEASIRVQQVAIGSRSHPFVRALLRAAERGVDVRVLLSGATYVRRENEAFVEWLNERARRDGLPIRARVVEPRSRFARVHAKAVVIDRSRVLLGSINWNNHSLRENREVAVLLDGRDAARYYGRVFRADWRGGVWRLPIGLAVGVLPALGVAIRYGVRIEFAPDREPSDDDTSRGPGDI